MLGRAHIRRFGPAILFDTKAFESFNAIIRVKSVHSNRHAPSQDIAKAFADNQQAPAPKFPKDPNMWKTVGAGPKHLVNSPNTVTSYLGLDKKTKPTPGRWLGIIPAF
ncbi:hypothetical protein B0H13DRAFT_2364971 [Mycena leptocephala]|nr:hypothetical protein B0H13DRAFT_2364971 [Mycena leptocephala]